MKRQERRVATMSKSGISSWLMILPLLAAGCTEIDLCMSDQHPHRTFLDFRYDWGGVDETLRTDSMSVLAVRPVNVMLYKFRITARENDNHGVMLSPQEERKREPDRIDEEGDISNSSGDCLWVRPGNYKFVSYTSDSELIVRHEDEEENADAEEKNVSSDMESLIMTYKPVPVYDASLVSVFGSWKTHNTYSDYVAGGMKPVYMAAADYIDVPVVADDGARVRVDFKPQAVTQHVEFVFGLEKESGIVVDSITGEISGVPGSMELFTGLLNPWKSYKMLFKLGYPALDSREDSLHAEMLTCSGAVDATGIVRSVNDLMQTGPGILQLAVYCHVTSEATDVMPSKMFQKIFYAGINLFNTLTETKLLEWEEEHGKYSRTCTSAVLKIGTVLRLSKEKVLVGGSGSTGLDRWFEGDKVDLDI